MGNRENKVKKKIKKMPKGGSEGEDWKESRRRKNGGRVKEKVERK